MSTKVGRQVSVELTWKRGAACVGIDPTVFYPVTDEAAEDAKVICNVCRVQETCLEYALTRRERDGVWGGATERERRRIIRRRQREQKKSA